MTLACGAAQACDGSAATRVGFLRLGEDFDVVLSDGRSVALAGIEPLRREQGWAAFGLRLAQGDLRLLAAPTPTDRWGRSGGLLFIAHPGEADAPPALAAQAALEAGLGRYRPDPAVRECREALLRAEQSARAGRRGLWREAEYAVIDASDREAVARAGKGLAIVEGIVSAIGETKARLYLNFGPRRTIDLAAVVSGRAVQDFVRRGVEPRKLQGRRIRIRGLMDRGLGPTIALDDPDALEVIDEGSATSAAVKTRDN